MTSVRPVVVAPVKLWWQSKTLWLNILAAALIALETQFSLLQPFLPGNVYAWVAVVLTVANSMLRIVTTQALAMQGKSSGAE